MRLKLENYGKKEKPVEKCLMQFYKLIADFGESYEKLFIWIYLSLVGSSVFLAFSINTTFPEALKNLILTLLPFRLAQSTGFIEGVKANTFALFLISFEGVLLIILLTLFTMAIRRRFRR